MLGCLVHLDANGLQGPRLAELCEGAAKLLQRLAQEGVPSALLLETAAGAAAAACLATVQCAAAAAAAPLTVAQPSQLPLSLRLTLDQLAPLDPSTVVFVSVSSSTAACSEATELGCCACEHLPARAATAAALQALALQAVASAAAAARRAAGLPSPLVVGYVMKESRQLALGQQGMLPLLPGGMPAAGAQGAPSAAAAAAAATRAHAAPERSLCFVPLDLASPLAPQLRRCHMVLQKLTDCLQPGGGSGAVAAFTAEAAALLAYLEGERQRAQQTGTAGATAAAAAPRRVPPCLVDPAAALLPVMDRAALVQHLEAAVAAVRQQAIPMRAPASLLLQSFDPSATPRQLAAVGVGMPCIVKPRAACGVAEAHQMAFVLHGSGFADLEVPLPAVAQEYVDHGGVVWKVYVAGQQVFWTRRKSTPNLGPLAQRLAADPDADIPSSIGFDSLKSLPTSLPWLRGTNDSSAAPAQQAGVSIGGSRGSTGGGQEQAPEAGLAPAGGGAAPPAPGEELMRQPTLEAVAAALRQRLGLTLFGFDLVFDPAAGELAIIDVNYFPSFKGIPEAPAALQAALWERWAAHAVAAAAAPR